MSSSCAPTAVPPPEPLRSLRITASNWKPRPAGSPAADMDAEVLALSPRALLEPGHLFACDVCGRRYQRVHNLHKHRQLHSVASGKMLGPGRKTKFVFVCPEPSCRRHDPARAMNNFARIKKHFQLRHGHLGTGHGGRVSSRQSQAARSSTEHQDTRDASQLPSPSPGDVSGGVGLGVAVVASQQLHARAASSASPSCGDLGSSTTAATTDAANAVAAFHGFDPVFTPLTPPERPVVHNMQELQLMPPRGSCARGASPAAVWRSAPPRSHALIPQLELSMWFGGARGGESLPSAAAAAAARLKEEAREQLRQAAAENAAAEAARAQARRQAELAGQELAIARRVREQAQAEFTSAHELRDHAVRQVHAAMRVQATCCGCRHKFSSRAPAMNSEVASYVSSVVTEVDDDGGHLNADGGPIFG